MVEIIVGSHVETHVGENDQVFHEGKHRVHAWFTVLVVSVEEVQCHEEARQISCHKLFLL